MAIWDFLSKDIGGSFPAVNDPGGLGVHAAKGNTGVTWGQALSLAGQQQNRQQQPAFGQPLVASYPGMSGQSGSTAAPVAPFGAGMAKAPGGDAKDMMTIAQIVGALFGVPI